MSALPATAGAPAGIAVAPGNQLGGRWCWLETLAGAADGPAALDDFATWLPAPVPGTVATAMRAAGRWNEAAPPPLQRHDYWYRVRFTGHGRRLLRFGGLAASTEAWLNGRPLLRAGHARDLCDAQVELAGSNTLHLCFRASLPLLHSGRASLWWRQGALAAASRPGTIGHAPASLPLHAVGPWHPLELLDVPDGQVFAGAMTELSSRLDGQAGIVTLRLHLRAPAPAHAEFQVDGSGATVTARLTRTGTDILAGSVRLDAVHRWWPHTHGQPFLYRVAARAGGETHHCGHVGFRTVDFDRGPQVNGHAVFCRGVRVTSEDLPVVAATAREAARWLTRVRDAGLNLVCLGGPDCHPGPAFLHACDALGILVRQDDPDSIAESLPVSAVPCARTLHELGLARALQDPRWKAGVPHPPGASWDAEDLRDRHLRDLYDVDPPALRREQPERYLRLSRALAADLMTDFASRSRRTGTAASRLVVTPWHDAMPGAGAGIIDVLGRPKSAWHALRQVCQPLQVLLTGDVAGRLQFDLINETAAARPVLLSVSCLRDGQADVAEAVVSLRLAARSALALAPSALPGSDCKLAAIAALAQAGNHVILARLTDAASGEVLSEAAYLPDRRAAALAPADLQVAVGRSDGEWWLDIRARRFARWVHIDDSVFLPAQDWFHLWPGASRRIRLLYDSARDSGAGLFPSGEVHAMNQGHPVRYAGLADPAG
ncbi:hypothetical protein [Cupriavidus sp. IDO]|uniref:hypothetical protein n=1 Tax=Cupriavidus sp. IDO TaxID=1539142 RepID=UPI000579429C|nr:hypothetical protein [Cupriavidus sp. IDO]KWR89005.1 hypothetical protein RM96_16620 [Cupriavidus sp. IDO]